MAHKLGLVLGVVAPTMGEVGLGLGLGVLSPGPKCNFVPLVGGPSGLCWVGLSWPMGKGLFWGR